jgi:COP9 signalosome complex subunit 4
MTCAILCKAGDTKFRLMAQIHKDERSKKVDPHFEILDKFFMGHLVKDSDIKSFEDDVLVDHQKAKDANGKTVLQAAIIEHNILVLSKIYLNITFTQLGKNLGIPAD